MFVPSQIEDMMERRVRDFRLDTRLRTACEEDIYTMCAYFGVSRCEEGVKCGTEVC
jgi:hypothetical protein